jgi:GNAT superfamily N-acetyltransferase
MAAMTMTIRAMTPADVEPAAAAVLAGGWGERTAFFRFCAGHAGCRPFVAVEGEAIVGTGVGTVNGAAGWVGTVFVAPAQRGKGLGRTLTGAVMDALEEAGCRTLVLVASEEGLPLYERLGFRVVTHYHVLERAGLPPDAPGTTAETVRVRAFEPADLSSMEALDQAASGEDRAHLLRALATPDRARSVVREGRVTGFVVRPPWAGGATVAPAVDDGVALLDDRRRLAGPERRVRTGVLAENEGGLARLRGVGWTEAWRAPRMERGEPLAWSPSSIWGQFQYAMG